MTDVARRVRMTEGQKAGAAAERATAQARQAMEAAFAARCEEIEGRLPFGSILAQKLKEQAGQVEARRGRDNAKLASVLRELASGGIEGERRGTGLRKTILQLGKDSVAGVMKAEIVLEIEAAINAALTEAGPAATELFAALDADPNFAQLFE